MTVVNSSTVEFIKPTSPISPPNETVNAFVYCLDKSA